ncbi:MAG: hypothetical protein K8S55_01805 [Phycisphaerae bacterium]|nr:hypothetical protein [Phycisphaerae bacterium]
MEKPKQPAPNKPVELPDPKVDISEDTKVIVEVLKGVRFISREEQLQEDPKAEGIDVSEVEVLNTPEFLKQIQPFLGKPASLKSIGEMVRATILYYRSKNRPVVDVIIPEQDVTSGIVQLLVIEGRLGKITVEGNNWFSDALIRSKIQLKEGDPIYAGKLLENVDTVNKNPFRYVRPVLSPGKLVGQTDLKLQTTDRFPYRFYAGYENTGTRTTRLGRYLAGVNMGNLWGQGHEAGYQFATNDKFSGIGIHSAYYRIPFDNGQKLAFFGNYATYDARHKGLDQVGQSWQLSTRYIVPLQSPWQAYRHELQLGFDFKRTDNDIEYGGFQIYDSAVDTNQFVLQYGGYLDDPLGNTSFTFSNYWGPGALSSKAQRADYIKARPGTDPNYFYSNLSLERIWYLPAEFTFVNRVMGQLSSERLLGSEQMGFGGYNTVRGYDEWEVGADEGLVLSLELRTPEIKLGKFFNKLELENKLQFLVFWDYGAAHNVGNAPGEDKSNTLQSIGAGLRYKIGPHASFRMDYGHRLNEVTSDFNDQGRLHIGVLVSY